jgi:hypothetical protein
MPSLLSLSYDLIRHQRRCGYKPRGFFDGKPAKIGAIAVTGDGAPVAKAVDDGKSAGPGWRQDP